MAEEEEESVTGGDTTARPRVWWLSRDMIDVRGSILFEHVSSTRYVIALEDASISLGKTHRTTICLRKIPKLNRYCRIAKYEILLYDTHVS